MKKYFDDLDRLENKRERQLNKDDIVKQLQRLEGATDERSRQKAKELRIELNEMNKENAKEDKDQARKDLLQSFDTEIENLEQKWMDAATNFVSAMATGGTEAGNALISVLTDAGLISEEEGSSNNLIYDRETMVNDLVQSGMSMGQAVLSVLNEYEIMTEEEKTAITNALSTTAGADALKLASDYSAKSLIEAFYKAGAISEEDYTALGGTITNDPIVDDTLSQKNYRWRICHR